MKLSALFNALLGKGAIADPLIACDTCQGDIVNVMPDADDCPRYIPGTSSELYNSRNLCDLGVWSDTFDDYSDDRVK